MAAEGLDQPQKKMRGTRTVLLTVVIAAIVVVAGFAVWYVYIRQIGGGDGVPRCAIVRESPTGLTFAISSITSSGVSWADVSIRLSNAFTLGDFFDFRPTQQGIESGNGQMTGPFKQGDVPAQIDCTLSDEYVRFVIGDSDHFTIIPNGTSLNSSLRHEVSLINRPYGEAMGSIEFQA